MPADWNEGKQPIVGRVSSVAECSALVASFRSPRSDGENKPIGENAENRPVGENGDNKPVGDTAPMNPRGSESPPLVV